jgi:hypothetical protein
LFDQPTEGPPREAHVTSGSAQPPVLGAAREPKRDAATSINLPALPQRNRWPWRIVLALVLLATGLNLAWIFRDQLPQDSALRTWLVEKGVPGFEQRGPFRDPERIHLVSRDFHAHPTRPGVLVLSATFINLADRPQPFPTMIVTLLDTDQRLLATREFAPTEYTLPGADPGALLQPNVHTPILLEFVDPGEHAVGFELTFR